MRAEGLEPSSSLEHRLLKPACIPFHHARVDQSRASDCHPGRVRGAEAMNVWTLGAIPEAVEPEEPDVVARLAVEREVGEDLADDGAELVAVTREAGADDDRL